MSAEKKGVWVLTTSHNDYDQHGEYLCCIWDKKPNTEQLADYFSMTNVVGISVMAALKFILHVENGGGRINTEQQWYHLKFVEFGKPYSENE